MARKKIPEDYEKMKQSVITATIGLLVEKSMRDFSMEEVAKLVGVTKAALYWYFPNKEALVAETVRSVYTVYIGTARAIAGSAMSATQKLRTLIAGNGESTEAVLMCLFPIKFYLDHYSQNHESKTLIREGYREYNAIVSGILEEGIKTGEFTADIALNETARLITASIDGLAFQNLLAAGEEAALPRSIIFSMALRILTQGKQSAADGGAQDSVE